jgi:hypothetical protein
VEREIPSGTRREHAELARHVLGFQSDDGLKETTYSVARRSFRGVTLIGNPAIPILRLKSFRTAMSLRLRLLASKQIRLR